MTLVVASTSHMSSMWIGVTHIGTHKMLMGNRGIFCDGNTGDVCMLCLLCGTPGCAGDSRATYLLLEYAGREGFNGVEPCGMAALTCCPQMQSPKRVTQQVPHYVEQRVASTGSNTIGG
jgi:hypothetical protein